MSISKFTVIVALGIMLSTPGVGHASDVGNSFHNFGHSVAHGAKQAGHSVKTGARNVGHSFVAGWHSFKHSFNGG
jgi:hypothetical protein